MASLACGYESAMSLAVDSFKSAWIRDTKQLGDFGTVRSFEYRGVFEYGGIFEYRNMKLKLWDI